MNRAATDLAQTARRKSHRSKGSLAFDRLVPMEAELVAELPRGTGWQFEPKWDGFRCLAYKNGSSVELKAKSGKPLTRYFPEIVADLLTANCDRFILDGELVIAIAGAYSFEALQMRLHPAESRIRKLATETPATLMAFDCLLDEDGNTLIEKPLKKRRRALEALVRCFPRGARVKLTRRTRDRRIALGWLRRGIDGTDGVVAKLLDLPYHPGAREMLKVKCIRTADCVVGGFRYQAASKLVGSLLLGLYDTSGKLDHIGFTSSISDAERPALTKTLEKLIKPPGFTGNAPGAPSRWSNARSPEWQPLQPKLVAEVRYDHVSGGRFRHGTKFVRWRPDKSPKQCTFDQIALPRR